MQWATLIEQQQQQADFQTLLRFIESERHKGKRIYPPQDCVFSALDLTPFDEVKVVILGQDPYHGADQAHGLAFSVQPNVKIPPSLMNIYKELQQDIPNFTLPTHGHLAAWAKQGVLLLNTVLTVEEGKAHSHANIGWEGFTDVLIAQLNQHRQGLIFVLWGAHAQKKGQNIDADKHHILTSAHPSPLSAYRGFFGCKHFSQINRILEEAQQTPIDWQI